VNVAWVAGAAAVADVTLANAVVGARSPNPDVTNGTYVLAIAA
jgi:hypothetical protein